MAKNLAQDAGKEAIEKLAGGVRIVSHSTSIMPTDHHCSVYGRANMGHSARQLVFQYAA